MPRKNHRTKGDLIPMITRERDFEKFKEEFFKQKNDSEDSKITSSEATKKDRD